VTTVFGKKYGAEYTGTTAAKNVAAIAFAGTVVGQLIFGFLSDHWSRTNSLVISTIILIVFTALASGSYYHGSDIGLFNILTAWRFFVGIGIGGEYSRLGTKRCTCERVLIQTPLKANTRLAALAALNRPVN
jgi:MFS family permease